MMLRSDAVTSEAKQQAKSQDKSENSTALTADEIETFFRVIAEHAYDLKNPYHGTLTIFIENYLGYLRNGLRNTTEYLFDSKKRILHEQIKILIEKQFFKDKINNSVLENIKKDLEQTQNNLPNFVKEDEREDLLSLLRNINDTNQALHFSKERYFPEKIRSGMSQSEKQSISYSLSYQAGSLSINQNNQGIQHYNKKEWEAAIQYFQMAIVAENDMAAELHIEKNEAAIAIYQRNIANAYANWAQDCQANNDYTASVQYAQNAIKEIDKIVPGSRSKKDSETRVRYQRMLVFSTHELGLSYYDQQLYCSAIMQFFMAIARNHAIPKSYVGETESMALHILLRDIAFAFESIGIKEFQEHEIDKSILHLESAIKALAKIPEPKAMLDQAIFADICRHLSLAFNALGMKYYTQNNLALALSNFDKAMVILMKIEFKFLIEADNKARQVIQNNYTHVLAQIEAERTAANIHRFFNLSNLNNPPKEKTTLKRIRSDEILSPHPLKRRKVYKSESELGHSLGMEEEKRFRR